MANYKVIQDIEAEDKLLGPLSFRQFIYFLAASFLGFLNFTAAANGAWFVLLVLGPPMLFCLFFAWPWSPDQPTEVWALARIRYYFKPRKRLWNQSGVKDFVTITVPKKIEKFYTDGLTQDQVRSRLEALSQTIDSRGWAVKNAYTNSRVIIKPEESDRLMAYGSMPNEVANYEVHDADDILDQTNNPAAFQMGQMIDASSKAHRQLLMDRLRSQGVNPPAVPAPPDWFQRKQMQQPVTTLPNVPQEPVSAPVALPAMPTAEAMPNPAPVTVATVPTASIPVTPIKTAPDAAILNLAHDNNMDVATLAREAARAKGGDLNGEVVVSLH